MNHKLACRYAIVRFVPYAETGEFANIGIVLTCTKTGYFDFKLQTRKYARITAFFNKLDSDFYRYTLHTIEGELNRIKHATAVLAGGDRADQFRQVFLQLVHPREAMIRFGDARAILTEDPEQELLELFEHYVNHDFVTKEYVEHTMTRRLQELLNQLPLTIPFRPAKLGNDWVHANFELVQKREKTPLKIIKAFNLTQQDPNDIYAHGDVWVPRIKRLRDSGFLPEKTLFTVELPSPEHQKRYMASQEVVRTLREAKITVALQEEEEQIMDFAMTD